MRQKVFAREHIPAIAVAVLGAVILAAAAIWLQRRPGPEPVRLTIPSFGQVQLATPEQRERMRRVYVQMSRESRRW